MAQIITTKGSLVLNTTSVYQITPGLGKKVSTTRVGMKVSTSSRGLGVKDYTPSMRATYSSMMVFHTSK